MRQGTAAGPVAGRWCRAQPAPDGPRSRPDTGPTACVSARPCDAYTSSTPAPPTLRCSAAARFAPNSAPTSACSWGQATEYRVLFGTFNGALQNPSADNTPTHTQCLRKACACQAWLTAQTTSALPYTKGSVALSCSMSTPPLRCATALSSGASTAAGPTASTSTAAPAACQTLPWPYKPTRDLAHTQACAALSKLPVSCAGDLRVVMHGTVAGRTAEAGRAPRPRPPGCQKSARPSARSRPPWPRLRPPRPGLLATLPLGPAHGLLQLCSLPASAWTKFSKQNH